MNAKTYARIKDAIAAAHDHTQQSGLGAIDSGNHIYGALLELTMAVRLLADEAKPADKVISETSQTRS